MHYKYYIVIYFRNGKTLPIYSNDVSVHKGPNSSQRYLWVDGDEIVALRNANAHVFVDRETIYYDAAPLPKLFPLLPTEWDQDEPSLRVIDKVIIDSRGRTLTSQQGD
jgi:hypothetical protein